MTIIVIIVGRLSDPVTFCHLIDAICATARLIVRHVISSFSTTTSNNNNNNNNNNSSNSNNNFTADSNGGNSSNNISNSDNIKKSNSNNNNNNNNNNNYYSTNSANRRFLQLSVPTQLAMVALIRKKVVHIINSNNRNIDTRHR
jgi:hypothetical protein